MSIAIDAAKLRIIFVTRVVLFGTFGPGDPFTFRPTVRGAEIRLS